LRFRGRGITQNPEGQKGAHRESSPAAATAILTPAL